MDEAIIKACAGGHLKVLKYLTEYYGISVTVQGNSPSIQAATYGHLKILKYLIRVNLAINSWAMPAAARRGHFRVVKYLLRKIYQSQDRLDEAFSMAAQGGHLRIMKYLQYKYKANPRGQGNRCLVLAATEGQLRVLKYLQSHKGFSVYDLTQAVEACVANNRLRCLRYLVSLNPDCLWSQDEIMVAPGTLITRPRVANIKAALSHGLVRVLNFLLEHQAETVMSLKEMMLVLLDQHVMLLHCLRHLIKWGLDPRGLLPEEASYKPGILYLYRRVRRSRYLTAWYLGHSDQTVHK
jgi:hypothetical protein